MVRLVVALALGSVVVAGCGVGSGSAEIIGTDRSHVGTRACVTYMRADGRLTTSCQEAMTLQGFVAVPNAQHECYAAIRIGGSLPECWRS